MCVVLVWHFLTVWKEEIHNRSGGTWLQAKILRVIIQAQR